MLHDGTAESAQVRVVPFLRGVGREAGADPAVLVVLVPRIGDHHVRARRFGVSAQALQNVRGVLVMLLLDAGQGIIRRLGHD